MLRYGRWALVVVAGLVIGGPVLAQDIPVETIPDDVSVVIKLKAPQKTIDNVVELVKQVQPKLAPLVQLQSGMIGIGISNVQLAGVDKTADWWLALFMKKAGEPDVVFIIPTTDMDAAKGAIPASYTAFAYKKWLVYSESEAALTRLKERGLNGKGKSISEKVDENTKTMFMDSTVSAFFNLSVVKNMFSAELAQAPALMTEQIEQLTEMTPEMPGLKMDGLAKVYLELASKSLQVVNDLQSFTLGITLNGQELIIDELLKVAPRSGTSKLLADNKPVAMTRIDSFPKDELGYFGIHCDMKKLTSLVSRYTLDVVELDQDKAAKLKEVLANYAEQNFGGLYSSFTLGEIDEGVLRSTSVLEVETNDKTRAAIREATLIGSDLNVGGVKQTVELKKEAETIGDHKVDVLKVNQEIDPAQDPLGIQKKLMDILYGPEGLTSRTVYLKDAVVQSIGGQAYTEKMLKTITEPATATDLQSQQKARLALGNKTNFIGLIDLPRMLLAIVKTAVNSGQLPAIPVDLTALTDLELKPSYIGFAVSSETDGLKIRTHIPVEQIQSIASLVEKVQKIIQETQQRGQQF